MSVVELFVGLKIPDTTAITTFHTIEHMGYKIDRIKRLTYYKFDIDGDLEKFKKKIAKVDIVVNANKNTSEFGLKEEGFNILVNDIDDRCVGLLSTLKDRLGLKEIKSIEKGVLWSLKVDSKKTAEEIAKNLLFNENYQEAKLL
ncbi:MAG: hypothetical protein ABIJ08_05705 [Nanoarchaeota archaeon]